MDPDLDSGTERRPILRFVIRDKPSLYAAYMPFIKGGGLFVPTKRRYALGEDLFLMLQLMDEKDPLPVAGRVVWITPSGAEGNRRVGVGIQFSEPYQDDVRRKIEEYLAGGLEAERPTHTM